MTVEQIVKMCAARGCKTLKECVTFMLTNYKSFNLEDCRKISNAYQDLWNEEQEKKIKETNKEEEGG